MPDGPSELVYTSRAGEYIFSRSPCLCMKGLLSPMHHAQWFTRHRPIALTLLSAEKANVCQGRAGLGEPIKDEDGNFVVNAHAFDNDSRDYVQKFTGRGHPSNPATNKAKKRLDRAQNEVLEIVGVVRSRHEQILQRRPEHGLSDRQLAEVVESEHDFGILIRAVFPALLDMSSWWILIHRTRLTVGHTCLSGILLTECSDLSYRSRAWLDGYLEKGSETCGLFSNVHVGTVVSSSGRRATRCTGVPRSPCIRNHSVSFRPRSGAVKVRNYAFMGTEQRQ